MAIKRVIIHLGMAKAGSSSIQRTLFNNAPILEKNGFRYLHEWELNHLIKFKYLFSPYPVSPTGTGHLGRLPVNMKQKNKKSIDQMMQVIKNSECETLILSGEYSGELWLDSTIENIKEFIKNYFQSNGIETTILYFVRNPLTWLASWLQQRLRKDGFMNKAGDFFEIEMKQYEGILNLHKHFADSLVLLKFEDACLDKDGLIGCFLKAIGFPKSELEFVTMYRVNESRCMEAMEFIYYVESIEPRHPYNNYRQENPNRYIKDLISLKHIKGVKFDLPYQSKLDFWERFRETLKLLKENAGIDYTDYEIPPSSGQETYSEETVQSFVDVFPKLSFVLQKHFLKFFEKKYMETAQVRFKQLHFKGSAPYALYNSKNVFFNLLKLRVKNKLRRAKKAVGERIPKTLKTPIKTIIKYKR